MTYRIVDYLLRDGGFMAYGMVDLWLMGWWIYGLYDGDFMSYGMVDYGLQDGGFMAYEMVDLWLTGWWICLTRW